MAVVKQKYEDKLTASFRIDKKIMGVLRDGKYPLSEVAQAGLLYFLNLSDADKFVYLLSSDYDDADLEKLSSNTGWKDYTNEILADMSIKKLLRANLSVEETLDTLVKTFLTQKDIQEIKTNHTEIAAMLREGYRRIEKNFAEKYPECPSKIERAIWKSIIIKFIRIASEDDAMWDFLKQSLAHNTESNVRREEEKEKEKGNI